VIVVIGDLMLDIFLLSNLRREEQRSGLLVRGGGSAANTAAWLATLGCDVTFVGCVGGDPPGRMLVSELETAAVRTCIRTVGGEETGCVAVDVTDRGERVMRSSRGANAALSPGDIAAVANVHPDFVHITGYALLGPYSFDLLDAAADLADISGARLSFDPSSLGVITSVGSRVLRERLSRAHVELLLPNRQEAIALSEDETLAMAMETLHATAPLVAVKDGERGAVGVIDGKPREVPTDVLQPLDTTGAGDAFNAGVIATLHGDDDLLAAVARGNEVAGTVIKQYGGRPLSSRPA
jgi:ribokinase